MINFLLSTEIIPLCLRTMEMGSELSKTVATFIVQKILLDEVRVPVYRCFVVALLPTSEPQQHTLEPQTPTCMSAIPSCARAPKSAGRAREEGSRC